MKQFFLEGEMAGVPGLVSPSSADRLNSNSAIFVGPRTKGNDPNIPVTVNEVLEKISSNWPPDIHAIGTCEFTYKKI